MEVGYRLGPETNFIEMVGDVRRAVAWMKAHAVDYKLAWRGVARRVRAPAPGGPQRRHRRT